MKEEIDLKLKVIYADGSCESQCIRLKQQCRQGNFE